VGILDILRGSEKRELKYCVVVIDAAGHLRALCDSDTQKLAEFVKNTRHACAIEIHPDGKTVTLCDASSELEKLFRVKLK
jgi:hypothetical protein